MKIDFKINRNFNLIHVKEILLKDGTNIKIKNKKLAIDGDVDGFYANENGQKISGIYTSFDASGESFLQLEYPDNSSRHCLLIHFNAIDYVVLDVRILSKEEIAKKIYNLKNDQSFDFQFYKKSGDIIYAAATAMNIHGLERVIVSAYGRNEYDRIFSELDTIEDIINKLDYIL